MNNIILSTAYFPPIDYFSAIVNADSIFLESAESYIKQSYRNRFKIYSANGAISLSIPTHKSNSVLTTEIDYSKPWVQQHKKALISAYNSSPFFEYYEEEIFDLLDKNETSLFKLNYSIILKMMELIGIKKDINLTSEFQHKINHTLDYRNSIHPKIDSPIINKPYYQIFSNKYGYIPNLSIVDLIFHEGPNSISYL